jgi:hypothetical protein
VRGQPHGQSRARRGASERARLLRAFDAVTVDQGAGAWA